MPDKPDTNHTWGSYKELAEQYTQAAQNISGMIARLRVNERKVSFTEAEALRRKIKALYEMHYDAVKAARTLREYAAKEEQA